MATAQSGLTGCLQQAAVADTEGEGDVADVSMREVGDGLPDGKGLAGRQGVGQGSPVRTCKVEGG